MIARAASLLLVLALVAGGSLVEGTRSAAAEVDIRSQAAVNRFPSGMEFTIFLASQAEVTDVRLMFRVLPDGVTTTSRAQCTSGANINCTTTIGRTRESYMVPGARIVYWWEISLADGERVTTEEQQTTYDDDRFDWESITEGNITVHFYFGDVESQRTVMRVTQETVDRIGEITGGVVDFPVNIWVYRTARDLQPAVASRRGQGPSDSIQTLGEVGASDTALVSRDTAFLDIVRHEVAHIVTRAAMRTHITDIPIWLNEGISSYAQESLLPGEEQALSIAIRRNSVLPIESLGASVRGRADVVSLFYAQSGSIVTFMLEEYGPEMFREFFTAMERDTLNGALEKVYGFDQWGLEDAWREHMGLPEAGTPQQQQPQPTAAPQQAPQQQQPQPTAAPQQAPRGATGSGGGGVSLLMVAGGLTLAMVLLLVAAGVIHLKTRRRPSA